MIFQKSKICLILFRYFYVYISAQKYGHMMLFIAHYCGYHIVVIYFSRFFWPRVLTSPPYYLNMLKRNKHERIYLKFVQLSVLVYHGCIYLSSSPLLVRFLELLSGQFHPAWNNPKNIIYFNKENLPHLRLCLLFCLRT